MAKWTDRELCHHNDLALRSSSASQSDYVLAALLQIAAAAGLSWLSWVERCSSGHHGQRTCSSSMDE